MPTRTPLTAALKPAQHRASDSHRLGAAARAYLWQTGVVTIAGLAVAGGLPMGYSGTKCANKFPADYRCIYGTNRPFAPSLAKTDTGGFFDAIDYNRTPGDKKRRSHRFITANTIIPTPGRDQ